MVLINQFKPIINQEKPRKLGKTKEHQRKARTTKNMNISKQMLMCSPTWFMFPTRCLFNLNCIISQLTNCLEYSNLSISIMCALTY